MRRGNRLVLAGCALSAALITQQAAHADDPLRDTINRIGYWHLHIKAFINNNGTTNIDREYDHCFDLRNPAPPVSKLAGWSCPEFNIQKTPTAFHSKGACSYNAGQMTTRTDAQLTRNGSATMRTDVSWSWTTPTGVHAQSHTTIDGHLIGECPVGITPNTQLRMTPAEEAIMHHNGQ